MDTITPAVEATELPAVDAAEATLAPKVVTVQTDEDTGAKDEAEAATPQAEAVPA